MQNPPKRVQRSPKRSNKDLSAQDSHLTTDSAAAPTIPSRRNSDLNNKTTNRIPTRKIVKRSASTTTVSTNNVINKTYDHRSNTIDSIKVQNAQKTNTANTPTIIKDTDTSRKITKTHTKSPEPKAKRPIAHTKSPEPKAKRPIAHTKSPEPVTQANESPEPVTQANESPEPVTQANESPEPVTQANERLKPVTSKSVHLGSTIQATQHSEHTKLSFEQLQTTQKAGVIDHSSGFNKRKNPLNPITTKSITGYSREKTWYRDKANSISRSTRLLADGLVVPPSIPRRDTVEVILKNPSVIEKKRFCWKCKNPIARTSLGTQDELIGNCPHCKTPYSFIPSLEPGTILAEQYAILGAFSYGGLGWLYLATDKNVSNRLVVLKGLLSIHDTEAHEVALAERQFLAEVEHPGIVRIFNFVEHPSPDGTKNGYIVMEFFPGKTLHELQKDYNQKFNDPRLPLELAIGYILEVLPALTYLHSLDLVYNDLKPENIMVSDDGTKLIDLGSVSAINAYGRIYGTPGFQAPDIIQNGPSPQSDIYTVGRTLTTLIIGPNLYKEYPESLPTPDTEPIFKNNDSLYRLLLKATQPQAEDRFESAEQLRIELFAVLREILSRITHRPHADISRLFSPQRSTFGINEILLNLPEIFLYTTAEAHFTADDVYASLPIALVDPRDPASTSIRAALSQSDSNIAVESLRNIELNDPDIADISAEYHFAMIRLLLDSGDLSLAKNYLLDFPKSLTKSWQYEWLYGLYTLLTHNFRLAYEHFFRVYEILPGEIAPRLAAAAAGELYIREQNKSTLRTADRITLKREKRSRWSIFKRNEAVLPQHSTSTNNNESEIEFWSEKAADLYEPIWTMDHGQISAVMGYARMKSISGKIEQAVDLLDTVPLTSRYYLIAKASAAMLLIYNRPLAELTEDTLRYAAVRIQSLPETDQNRLLLRALLFTETLSWFISQNDNTLKNTTDISLLGYDFSENGMRLATEKSYRQLARLAPQFTRYRLVDLANSIRPRTKF